MPTRLVFTLLVAAALATSLARPGSSQIPESTTHRPGDIPALVAGLRYSAQARDSLTALADSAAGATREFFEEQIWQHQAEIYQGLLALAEKIEEEKRAGRDVSEPRRLLSEMVRVGWPRELAQLRRRGRALEALVESRDKALGAERLTLESELTRQADRLLEAYRSLADALQALQRTDIDVSEQRDFLVHELSVEAEGLVTRLQLAVRDQADASDRYSREASNTDLRYAYEASQERFKRATHSLSIAILLMDRFGLETTDLRVALIVSSGRITTDVFKWKVLLGLLRTLGAQVRDFLAARSLPWLFHLLLIVLTFVGFRALAQVVRSGVRHAVKYSQFSALMRDTIVRLSGIAVMVIGFLVILTQLGVRVAPLLAGLGIVGVAVGFAMQNTLANFAAGGMILGNQPFDVGDEIEVAGVLGTVRRMSLVSTTILTPDNQTLVIPNSTIWGGVIRNRTAQPIRRVDLAFGVGYGDDIEKAERVLHEVVAAQRDVLPHPAPIIKLDRLADSSVIFVVRVWTAKERYADVSWDLTRAVKLRFDQEGLTIPFPQREVHLTVGGAAAEGVVPPGAARPSA